MNAFNNLKVSKKILSGYFVILCLMVSIATVLLFNLNNLTKSFTFLVEHDQPVLTNAYQLQKLVVDMETGERGFLITGQEEYLEPYYNAIKEFGSLLETEKQLVSDNPPQVAVLEKIGQLQDEWIQKAVQPEIAKRREANLATVTATYLQEILKGEVGKGILDKLRRVLAQMETNLTTKGDLESVILTIKIAKDMVDQETGQRGFIITGAENFLEPYQQGQVQLKTDILGLRSRLLNDSENLTLLNQVELLATQWLEKAGEPEIQARREMNANPVTMADVSALIQVGTGKNILDAIRAQFEHFLQIEIDLNIVRSHHAQQNVKWAWILIISLTLGSIILILILGLITSQSITQPLTIITQMANQMAVGHLNQMVKSSHSERHKMTYRQDEMGDIGRSYEALAHYFQAVIADIVQVSQGLAAGNLNITPQTEYQGDFGQIKMALEKALSNQQLVIEDIVQVSQGIASGNTRIMPQVEYQGDFVQIKKALETALANQQQVIEDIVQVSQGLAAGNLQAKPQVEYRGDFIQIKNTLEMAMANQRQVIEDIVKVSQGLAEGNLSITPQSNYQGDFRHIKKAQEMALSNQRQVIEDLVHISQGLADGQLHVTSQAIYQGDFVQIKEALETALTNLRQVIEDIVQVSQGLAEGSQKVMPQAEYRGDFSLIKQALEGAATKLAETTTQNAQQDWLKTGQARLNDMMRGEQNIVTLAKNIIAFLTTYIKAQVGLFYLLTEAKHHQPILQMIASYAYTANDNIPTQFLLGEGLVGQVALEQKSLSRIHTPEEYTHIIQSGLANTVPSHVILLPCLYENTVKAVIEIGSSHTLPSLQQDFLEQVMPSVGIAVNTAESRTQMQELLQTSQQQTEELQSQSEELQSQQEEMQQINEELQHQREELETKQAELQQRNEELQSQAEELQSQSEELQTQQEELRQTNETLEERTQELERQKSDIQHKNLALEKNQAAMKKTQVALETKATELELASQYKSEFLANMSHELRTPLNSLLILAQLLADNNPGNLTDKQVEYASTIHSAGSDLLTLINEILDLSKVEAGKIEVNRDEVSLPDLIETLEPKFRHQATEKGVAFQIMLAEDVPSRLYTDGQRLKQILHNLLSNAFKFTSEGEVRLEIEQEPSKSPLAVSTSSTTSRLPVSTSSTTSRLPVSTSSTTSRLPVSTSSTTDFQSGELLTNVDSPLSQRGVGGDFRAPTQIIAFRVIDTGIGIPKDKQQTIFEAFQQVDGSTSRRYGGTGLGLSISRQLAQLLGGELQLHSEEGQGSTFTFYLPQTQVELVSTENVSQTHVPTLQGSKNLEKIQPVIAPDIASETTLSEPKPTIIKDDRMTLAAHDKSLLIIEDDDKFSGILIDLGHEKAFKCLLAEDGRTGLQLAEEYQPTAIILDVGLPQIDGWTVMEHLKDNPDTRHIPVHFISATEQNHLEATKMGAIGFLHKPVNMKQLGEVFQKIERFITSPLKNLLVIVDMEPHQQKILELVSGDNIKITLADTTVTALKHLKEIWFDCIVLDMDIEQSAGEELLKQMQQIEGVCQTPVIIYADRDLTPGEEALLLQCADHLPIKAVSSSERLLDEATLFLHQVEAHLPIQKRQMLRLVHDKEAILNQKKVLIVDDDVRNVFALATVLEEKQMEVIAGNNGNEALELLEEQQDIAIVLMDIMMPEMDGYEAMRKIREQTRFRKLPIIALTAKAMKGDKNKCIEAGANDYLSKPVDTDKLISLMRVWLYR
jgi:signal transduction histidine kinase/CheY-like chemotaxis protein/CHASE3 domain sensor protein